MLSLDYRDRRPLYEQIIDRIEDMISGGILKPDEQLPSVRQLAMELSINPNTIQRSYMELEKREIIYSVKGKGNFVSSNPDALIREKQNGLLSQMRDVALKAAALKIPCERLVQEFQECYQKAKEGLRYD